MHATPQGWGSIGIRHGTHLNHHLLKCGLYWEGSIHFPQNYFLIRLPKHLFLCSEQQEHPRVDKLTTGIFCPKPVSQGWLCQRVTEFWSCELESSVGLLLPCEQWKQLQTRSRHGPREETHIQFKHFKKERPHRELCLAVEKVNVIPRVPLGKTGSNAMDCPKVRI